MKKLIVYQINTQFTYEVENLIQVFALKTQCEWVNSQETFLNKVQNGAYGLMIDENLGLSFFTPRTLTPMLCHQVQMNLADTKLMFKHNLFKMLENFGPSMSKWGILVGIRPVKIVHELLDEGWTINEITERLETLYLIDPEKVALLTEIALRERPHLYPIDERAISLYLCIPFCPTRCVYCSFPSNDLQKKGKYVAPYVEALIKELIHSAKEIRKANLFVDCIYIGGGTPTALSANHLKSLLEAIKNHVDLTLVKEYTVEAGRPDTIDDEKLSLLKAYGVDRICVNPQTMNDATLKAIGRLHSVYDIDAVMEKVKAYDFKNVNMDLIMGLPGEGIDDVKRTLHETVKWAPDNVTVHTLSLKKASLLIEKTIENDDALVSEMVAYADAYLRNEGLSPYYMYRQKKIMGHLENVGYAKDGAASLYNMRIIEERHTILALGAGAVSKICYPKENRHERVANFKGVEEYLRRFDEILEKKNSIRLKGEAL